jgi:hypothetical protein
MSHHEDLLGRAAYYLQKALDSKSIRQAADMLELAYFFKRMAYDVRALEMARWPCRQGVAKEAPPDAPDQRRDKPARAILATASSHRSARFFRSTSST